jgi:hypothetical protein
MNDLASEYGFDCWDNSELELVWIILLCVDEV